jgi:predicted ATPase
LGEIKNMAKVVVTGAPCSGKTTLMKELDRLGFLTIKESAEEVFLKHEISDYSKLPMEEWIEIQKEISEMQMEKENNLPKDKTAFLDRSLVDSIPYFKLRKVKFDDKYLDHIKSSRYDAIFFCEITKPYVTNNVRSENEAQATVLRNLTYDVYIFFGYRPVILGSTPTGTVGNRIETIMKYLNQ